MNIFISLTLVFLSGAFFAHYFIPIIITRVLWRKHRNGKHYCNHCRLAYFDGRDGLNTKYCNMCGRPLEHFKLEGENQNGADVESEEKDEL